MSKPSKIISHSNDQDLEIPPLTDEFFKRARIGRHYARTMTNSNVVRVAPDLIATFPNEQTVNQALRDLIKIRQMLAQFDSVKPKRRKSA